MSKFEIKVTERAADWRESLDRDAALQCGPDSIGAPVPERGAPESSPSDPAQAEPQSVVEASEETR